MNLNEELKRQKSDLDKKGVKSPNMPQQLPVPCPANGRWVTNQNCDANFQSNLPCVTIDYNVPQIGQIITVSSVNGIPMYEEVTQVQPSASWPSNPGMFTQGQLTSPSYVSNFDEAPPGTLCPQGTVSGCMDPTATNYDPLATVDDGSCNYGIVGCTASNFTNAFPDPPYDYAFSNYIPPDPSACRACGLGAYSYLTANPLNPTTPSPSPNFATVGDLCAYIDTNSCC